MSISLNPNCISIPRGQEASFEEMQSCGNILQTFIRDQELQLQHLDDTKRHNEIIDFLQSLANGYNEELQVFKKKEKENQRQLIVAVMQFSTR